MTHAPRHIKDGLLECYLVDALAPDVRARLEAQLATSPADQARLEELRADSAAFLTSYPEGPLVARYEAEHQNSSSWWRWVRMALRMDGSSIRRENPTEVAATHPISGGDRTDIAGKYPMLVPPSSEHLAASLAEAAADTTAQALAGTSHGTRDEFVATEWPAVIPVGEPSERAALPAPRVRKAKKSNVPMGIALRLSWGDQRVGELFLAPGQKRAIRVGSAKGVDFVMDDSKLGGPSLDVVRCDAHSFSVAFTGKMEGELTRKGETLDLRALIETGKASHEGVAYVLTLESNDSLWIGLGGVTLEVVFQPVPKRVYVPLSESVSYAPLNIFLVTFLLGSLFVISARNRGEDENAFADDLGESRTRLAKLVVKPPEAQKNPLIEKMQAQKEKQQQKKSGEMAAKHKGEEGQMGKKDAPRTGNRTAPKGDPNKKDQARALTAKIFGGGKGGVSTIFGTGGLGGEIKSAMGNMFGAKARDSGGFGGMGLRGGGGGGGGTGETIGIGGVGTKGRGGGTGNYGTGVGVLGGKQGVDVGIAASDPVVMGSLDKELIRQVIKRNIGQIRFCYESQLNRFPKLNGRVMVKFIITEDGSVASSNVASSTVGNAELESCAASRVRTWLFPKPKGGGVVVVTYPFNFTRSGE